MSMKFTPLKFQIPLAAGGVALMAFNYLQFAVPHGKGLIKYIPGESEFETMSNELNENQKNALDFIKKNILNKDFLNYFRGDREHKIFPHPICLVNYLNDLGFKVEEFGFIKYNIGYFSKINYLLAKFGITTKFSNYVGICARKL